MASTRCWCRWATFQDGINAARRTLPLCVFHPRYEETGFAALEQYRREWDDEKKAFRQSDVHDWTAHPAAAFRYLSLAWRLAERREVVDAEAGGLDDPATGRGARRHQAVTPEEMTNRSSKLLEQFDGLETGSVISILATALQMAVCYGARNKEDAMHMISCIMVDAEHDMPRQYDLVQGMREMVAR